MTGAGAAGQGRVYRRTLGTRLLAALCALLFVGAAISYASTSGLTPWGAALGGMALLSLCNLATAWADRYLIDADGIVYRNALLARLGQAARRVGWDEVVGVREHHRLRAGRPEGRPSALFLTLRSGRRLVLDSLEDLDEVLSTVRRRCGDPSAAGEAGRDGLRT